MLLTSRSVATAALLSVLALGGCTDEPEATTSGTQPGAVARTRLPPPSIATPSPTMTRQPEDESPVFRDRRVRNLYWKAVAGSCLRYLPPYKDQPVYYDRFPRLELMPCTSRLVTHKVVKRYEKHGSCAAGQARYTLGHPVMSYQTVMTLCLRSLLPPSPQWPNIQPIR